MNYDTKPRQDLNGKLHRDIPLPDWAIERGRSANFFPRPDVNRTALIVIDMQAINIDEKYTLSTPYVRGIVPNINRLLKSVRSAGIPVFWTRHTFTRDGFGVLPQWQLDMPLFADAFNNLSPGAHAHEIHSALDVMADDYTVDKYRNSCFLPNSSNLDEKLLEMNIDTIIIVGTYTNGCCECSARDATMLGFKVLAVSDAMATATDEEQHASLLNMRIAFADIVTVDEMIERIAPS